MKSRQLSLFDKKTEQRFKRRTHGGIASKGHRKLDRPFGPRKPMHVVLKSDQTNGSLSLLAAKNQTFIRELIYKKGAQFGVKIGDYVNMGNHLHIQTKTATRAQFQKFLRSITGRIARHVTGAKRGKRFGRFWQGLTYTRVLTSTFEELRLRGYFSANRTELAAGKHKREQFLREFNAWARAERLRAKGKESPPKGDRFEDGAPAWA